MKKRIAALLLALILCFAALPGMAFARETSFFFPLPPAFDFNELRLNGMAVAELESACSDALELMNTVYQHSAVTQAWDRLGELQTELDLQLALTTIRYYQDPAAYGEAYTSIVNGRNAALQKLHTTQQALLRDPMYGPLLRLYIGFGQAAAILEEDAASDELLALLRQENELVVRYQSLSQADPATVVDGASWTMRAARDAYLADPANGQDYLSIYYDLYAKRNETLGQIYLQLVAVRNLIARQYGYGNYAEYAYDALYFRDYSLDDAAVFRETVKRQLSPLFRILQLAVRCGVFTDGTSYGYMGQEALLDAVAPCMEALSSELAASFAYMRSCHLVDLEFSRSKLSTTFTVSLPGRNTGYVNLTRQGNNRDLFSLIHEFGHFNAFSRYARTGCYDALEVHSQGLEALCLNYADQLFGADARAQSGYELYQLLHSVMTGCAYDELQLYAYTTDGLTLDALNRKSAELCAQYVLQSSGPEGVDYSWVEITHSFESPMYYISYATSAFAALQLWLRSRTAGVDEAADLYLEFVSNCVSLPGFRAPILASGMDDPFEAGTLDAFAQRFSSDVYGGLCGVPYADTPGSWAEGEIVLLYLLGILNGTSDTTFSPDRTLTRAMAVTALHRAVGEPESDVDAAAVFSDVEAGSWYADAVGWAIEAGVTDGTSETAFSPTKPVTCQEFAAMLFRQRFGPDFEYSGAPAPESAADWARGALSWCIDEAVFRSEDGVMSPRDELTRAEFACAIVGAIYE